MNEHLQKLTETEFFVLDLQLYLDTHPHDTAAIAEYNKRLKDAAEARTAYEKHFGPLFSGVSPSDPNKFNWAEDPMPWERP